MARPMCTQWHSNSLWYQLLTTFKPNYWGKEWTTPYYIVENESSKGTEELRPKFKDSRLEFKIQGQKIDLSSFFYCSLFQVMSFQIFLCNLYKIMLG